VIRLAAAIGIDVVAEGVETSDQLARLEEMGCPLVQGYYIARPQPADATEALIMASIESVGSGVLPGLDLAL
jgi:EAL domain-containing protein (putative c-di-GMP-specific phosphodiesterase class I)